MLIVGDKITGGENYVIELSEDQIPLIMKEFENDLSKMCENLEVVSKRLVLLNPWAKSLKWKWSKKRWWTHTKRDERATIDEVKLERDTKSAE